MNESVFKNSENDYVLIDPVHIRNKFAISSTFKDDFIFGNSKKKFPLFCAGIVKDFGENVYNIKKNEKIVYISQSLLSKIILSSNTVLKVNEFNINFIAVLPYVSYGMNIIRKINPKIGENVIIIGLNLLSVILAKIMSLSAVNVILLREKDNKKNLILTKEIDFVKIIDIDNTSEILDNIRIDKIIFLKRLDHGFINTYFNGRIIKPSNLYFITLKSSENKIKEKIQNLNIIKIPEFDIGFSDPNYCKGIKYPYSYIRWNFKTNLQFFIKLVETNKISLDFIKINQINVNNFANLRQRVQDDEKEEIEKLILYKITN